MAATDRYPGFSAPDGPYGHAFAITEEDDADLAEVTNAIYVGSAGALHVLMADGSDVTFTALPIGIHRLRIRKVFEDSVASSLVGLV